MHILVGLRLSLLGKFSHLVDIMQTCKFYMYTFVLKTVVSVFLNSSVWFAVWAPVFSLVYQYFSV